MNAVALVFGVHSDWPESPKYSVLMKVWHPAQIQRSVLARFGGQQLPGEFILGPIQFVVRCARFNDLADTHY